jgi:hypothetical protein
MTTDHDRPTADDDPVSFGVAFTALFHSANDLVDRLSDEWVETRLDGLRRRSVVRRPDRTAGASPGHGPATVAPASSLRGEPDRHVRADDAGSVPMPPGGSGSTLTPALCVVASPDRRRTTDPAAARGRVDVAWREVTTCLHGRPKHGHRWR